MIIMGAWIGTNQGKIIMVLTSISTIMRIPFNSKDHQQLSGNSLHVLVSSTEVLIF